MYLFVIAALRIMGKRQIGELQPSELVVAIMISELAAIPIQDNSRSILSSFIVIATLLIGEVALSYICLKSPGARRIVTGAPSTIIERGKVNQAEMRRLRFNLADLTKELRIAGISHLQEVEFCIMETNGKVSVIPKSENRPVQPGEMNITPPRANLSYIIIEEGRVSLVNLKLLGFDGDWLAKRLKSEGIQSPKDVFYMGADRAGNVLTIKREGA